MPCTAHRPNSDFVECWSGEPGLFSEDYRRSETEEGCHAGADVTIFPNDAEAKTVFCYPGKKKRSLRCRFSVLGEKSASGSAEMVLIKCHVRAFGARFRCQVTMQDEAQDKGFEASGEASDKPRKRC